MALIKGYLIEPFAELTGADLTGANLSHSLLEGADTSGAGLSGVNLSHTSWSMWSTYGSTVGSTLVYPNFGSVNHETAGANLVDADLSNARQE